MEWSQWPHTKAHNFSNTTALLGINTMKTCLSVHAEFLPIISGHYYNVSKLEDVAVGIGSGGFGLNREQCGVRVPKEGISQWAEQQEMSGMTPPPHTHRHSYNIHTVNVTWCASVFQICVCIFFTINTNLQSLHLHAHTQFYFVCMRLRVSNSSAKGAIAGVVKI